MTSFDPQSVGAANPAPGLLILTGASHTGKTSVAREVLSRVDPPAAFLSVDDLLHTALARPPGDIWEEIPLAYKMLKGQLETLLDQGWFVVFESTFTYVPNESDLEFHGDFLLELIAVAESRKVTWLLAQLSTGDEVSDARAMATGRVSREIVRSTNRIHATAELPRPDRTIRLDSTHSTAGDLARRTLSELQHRR